MAAIHRWFEAHDLLPPGGQAPEEELPQQIEILEDGSSSETAILRALILLAHSETLVAVEALRRYRTAPRPGFEELAELALEEAEFWAVEALAPPKPPPPPRDPGANEKCPCGSGKRRRRCCGAREG